MSFLFKSLQFNTFPVKYGISGIIQPIAHDSRQSMVAALVLHGLVLMAENEEINCWVELGLLLGVLVEARFGNVVVIAVLHFIVQLLQAVLV